jgi:hypothetical protein
VTNGIAAALALAIAAAVAADLWFGWEVHLRLGRALVALIEWLAFWR